MRTDRRNHERERQSLAGRGTYGGTEWEHAGRHTE